MTTKTRITRDGTESATARGAGARRELKVLSGEGMLEAVVDFSHEGELFRASKSRVVPEHPIARRFPNRFRPAMEGDDTPAIERFRARHMAPSRRSRFHIEPPSKVFGVKSPWRIEPDWRLR
jgi:hypothetical protein